MEHHPKAEQIYAFATGRLEGGSARRVVAHLIHGCADCGAAVAKYLEPEAPEAAYDEACDQAIAVAFASVIAFRRAGPPRPRPHVWSS